MPSSKDFSSDKLLQDIQSFMDRMEAKYRRAFLALVESTTRSPELGAILRSINDGSSLSVTPDVYSAIENIDIDTTTLRDLARQAMSGGGKVTAKAVGLEGRFDITNPRAIQYARSVSSELVTGITKTVRQNLRDIIADAVDGSESVAETVRRIKSEVGLTPRYSAAVRNYRKQLIANGKTTKQANQAAEKYAQKLLTQRARTIARTEIAQATNFGQHEFWRQMQDSGDLPPETMRMWITAQDEKTCPICGPMNGELTTIDGSWLTGSGPLEEPHAHPNCRCTSGLVFPTKLKKNDTLGWEHWLISKHGRHDQKTHGHRFGSRGEVLTESMAVPPKNIITRPGYLGRDAGDKYLSGIFGVTGMAPHPDEVEVGDELFEDAIPERLYVVEQTLASAAKRGVQLDDAAREHLMGLSHRQQDVFFSHLITGEPASALSRAIAATATKGGSVQFMPGVTKPLKLKHKTQARKDEEVDALNDTEYARYEKAPEGMSHDMALTRAVMGKKAFEVAYGLAERTAPKSGSPSAPKVFQPNRMLSGEKHVNNFGKSFEVDHAIRGLNAAKITATRTLPKSVKVGTVKDLEISDGDEVRAWFVLTNKGEIHPAGYADRITNQREKALAFFPLKVEVVSGAIVLPTTVKRTFPSGVSTTSTVRSPATDAGKAVKADSDKLVNSFTDSSERYAFETGVIDQMPSYDVREGVFTVSSTDLQGSGYVQVISIGGTITSTSQPLSKSSVAKHGQHDQSTHGHRGAKFSVSRYGKNNEYATVDSFDIDGVTYSVSSGGDSPGGSQYNGYYVAYAPDGKKAGYLDYQSDSETKTSVVAMVETESGFQRKGVAEALLDSFLIENPEYEISPGYTTDEGAKWWRSITGGDGPIKGKRISKHGQHDQSTHGKRGASSTRVAQSTEDAFAKSFAMQGSQSNLTTEESLALEDYKVSSYQDVNDHLRGVKRKLTLMEEKLGFGQMSTDEIVKAVGNLDKAFEKTSVSCDKPTEVFRGMSLPKGAWHSKIKAGDVIEDLGFVSTSQSKNSASRFSSPTAQTEQVIFTIKLPTGTKVMAGDSSELELVLNRGTKMRVTKVDTWTSGTSSEKTGYNIEVEVVK